MEQLIHGGAGQNEKSTVQESMPGGLCPSPDTHRMGGLWESLPLSGAQSPHLYMKGQDQRGDSWFEGRTQSLSKRCSNSHMLREHEMNTPPTCASIRSVQNLLFGHISILFIELLNLQLLWSFCFLRGQYR